MRLAKQIVVLTQHLRNVQAKEQITRTLLDHAGESDKLSLERLLEDYRDEAMNTITAISILNGV